MRRGWSARKVLIVAVAAGALGWPLAYRVQVEVLERRLVREANEIMGAPRARPVHVEPAIAGTFGEALTPYLPAIEHAGKDAFEDEADRATLRAVVAGERPLDALPARARGDLERLGPALDGVLRATHAARADFASAEDGFDPSPGGSTLGLQYTALLAGARIRVALTRGDAPAATRDCLDGLALARDLTAAGGLVGRMVGAVIVDRLLQPCAGALTSLPPSARPTAIAALRGIRDAQPGLDALVREEAVWIQLMVYGPGLAPARKAELLPRPRLMAGEGSFPAAQPPWKRVLYRITWPFLRARYASMTEAAALPAAERDARFEALGPGWSVAPDASDFLHYLRRADVALRELDLVVVASAAAVHRDRHGDWPVDCRVLAAEGLLTAGELERVGSASISPIPGGALEVGFTLPWVSEDQPARFVSVRANP